MRKRNMQNSGGGFLSECSRRKSFLAGYIDVFVVCALGNKITAFEINYLNPRLIIRLIHNYLSHSINGYLLPPLFVN